MTKTEAMKLENRCVYPNYNMFGHKTLVINRERFEEIRKKYLDKKG